MLSKYINQFMNDNDLSVNEEFFIENMNGKRIKLGFADRYKIEDIDGGILTAGVMNKTYETHEPLPGGKMPTKAHRTDAAWDCYAREDVTVGAAPVLVGLGFMIEPPEGYYVEIVPRSSIGLKNQLRQTDSIGIIDNGYRNEVKAMYESRLMPSSGMLDCITIPQKIKAGDRIAQMILRKQEEAELVEVDELSETDRGAGGFGSTGK